MPKKNSRSRPLHSIPRATFARLVREYGQDRKSDLKWSAGALAALQDDAEQLLTERFARAGKLSDDFAHKTVGVRHFQIGS